MPQMRVAFLAQHFGALHEQRIVLLRLNVFVSRRRPETRPAGAGIELLRGPEQRRAAARAAVEAVLVVVPVPAREGTLRAGLAGDGKLVGRQFLLPLSL